MYYRHGHMYAINGMNGRSSARLAVWLCVCVLCVAAVQVYDGCVWLCTKTTPSTATVTVAKAAEVTSNTTVSNVLRRQIELNLYFFLFFFVSFLSVRRVYGMVDVRCSCCFPGFAFKLTQCAYLVLIGIWCGKHLPTPNYCTISHTHTRAHIIHAQGTRQMTFNESIWIYVIRVCWVRRFSLDRMLLLLLL